MAGLHKVLNKMFDYRYLIVFSQYLLVFYHKLLYESTLNKEYIAYHILNTPLVLKW